MALPANNRTTSAETPRLRALRNLAGQLPVANQRIAAGQQAARDIQLQQAVAQAPVTAQIPTAQVTGAAVAQQAGQQAVQAAQQGLEQRGQIAQVGLAEQARQQTAETAGLRAGAREAEMENIQRFADLSRDAKRELYDKQMRFDRDELGRAKMNEIQLADYARLSARNDEEFRNYAQAAEQLSKRKLQVMEFAYKKIQEDLTQKMRVAEQKKDQQSMRQIQAIQQETKARMQRERARAANRQAAWTAGGTIVGAAVGAFGGPAGAAAGASVGGAVGGLAGSQS